MSFFNSESAFVLWLEDRLKPVLALRDEFLSLLTGKASQSQVDSLTTQVGSKAEQTDLNAVSATVVTKADQSQVDNIATQTATKATTSTFGRSRLVAFTAGMEAQTWGELNTQSDTPDAESGSDVVTRAIMEEMRLVGMNSEYTLAEAMQQAVARKANIKGINVFDSVQYVRSNPADGIYMTLEGLDTPTLNEVLHQLHKPGITIWKYGLAGGYQDEFIIRGFGNGTYPVYLRILNNGQLVIGNTFVAPNIEFSGNAPSILVGPGMGTGGSATVRTGSADGAGGLILNTGTSTLANSTLATVNFNAVKNKAPKAVLLTAANSAAAWFLGSPSIFVDSMTPNGFKLKNRNALGASESAELNYLVIF